MSEQSLPLSELIKKQFDHLSDGQKKVAKFVLENPEDVVFSTASQIGFKISVSESTVIRFAYTLGLNGFIHLQQLIREQFIKKNSTVHRFRSSTESIEKDNLFNKVLAKDVEIINNLVRVNKEEVLWETVDSIIQANRIVVIGHRTSYGPAYWFSFVLNLMLGNVYFYPSTRDPIEEIMHLSKESVVVAISFPRYAVETPQFTKRAKEKGAKIIGITDQHLSPVGRLSDITLTTEANTMSGVSGISPVSSLLNLIIAGISSKQTDSITKKLTMLEREYDKYKLFEDF